MEPGAPATPRPLSRLALSTGFVVLVSGKDTTTVDLREGKIGCLKGNKKETGK
jgi:hypothetical protein